MNILNIFYNFNQGGVEQLGIAVSNCLANRGGQPHVCIISSSYSNELIGKFSSGVKVSFLEKTRHNHRWNYVWQIVKYIGKNKIDVLHVHQGDLMPLYLVVKLLNPKIKLFFTVHDTYIFSSLSSINQIISKMFCKKIIAISDAVSKDIQGSGVKANKIVRIYNGVNFDCFHLESKKRKHMKGDCIRISNVARFFPHKKGQDILIEAIRILRNDDIKVSVSFAGAEPDGVTGEIERMKYLAEKIEVEDCVSFLGNIDDVSTLLSETDIFCIPSRYEGFGISAVEALASGIPCVASNIPGLNEVVDSHSLGEVFEMENKDDLARKLKKVIEHIDEYDAQKIRGNVYQRFSIESMVDQLIKVYGESI